MCSDWFLDEQRLVDGVAEEDAAQPFEQLAVWRRAARLSSDIYRGLKDLRDWGFRDQITRAGLSIPSNIAEGYERDTNKDFIKFLHYAKGSAGELRTQIYIGIEIGYIDKPTGHQWLSEAKQISKMLAALIKARKSFAPNPP
ncbi:four helix bundle protein [Thiocapsa marina]|uniref:S23 ribosomal protein n=1 Tax=Thiocapsa marina 5811 TaxID=768671 RepID=F9UIV0_9GAMM|nr:four helix bundle protein [Thiocapsa marina]EGV15861.1 S23 ribosomal protein [Thiocapsa marina 5811]